MKTEQEITLAAIESLNDGLSIAQGVSDKTFVSVVSIMVEFYKEAILDSQSKVNKKWKFCPECGCDEIVNENLVKQGYRECKKCGQEWWIDIHYTDEVKLNLSRLKNPAPKSDAVEFAEWIIEKLNMYDLKHWDDDADWVLFKTAHGKRLTSEELYKEFLT